MGIRYKIDVLQELKEAGYNTNRLRKERIFAEGTIQKFRDGVVVTATNLERLCAILKLQPGDIIEYVE